MVGGRHHRLLGVRALPLIGNLVGLHLVGLGIEHGDTALVHHRRPDIAVAVGLQLEKTAGLFILQDGDRVIDDLAGLRVHLADELAAEIAVPDLAVLHDDVVRHGLGARQVVGGDDDARAASLGTRERLQRILPRLVLREIHAGEKSGGLLDSFRVDDAAVAARAGQKLLRTFRRRARRIGAHARNDLHERFRSVRRGDNALQRVTADAILQERLLIVRTRHARQPFGARHVRRDIVRLHQLEVGARGLAGGDVGCRPAACDVAGGADPDGVVARLEPVGREAIAPLLVGHDRRGDAGAVLPGGDQNAFHGALLR